MDREAKDRATIEALWAEAGDRAMHALRAEFTSAEEFDRRAVAKRFLELLTDEIEAELRELEHTDPARAARLQEEWVQAADSFGGPASGG